jgi:hypothetical protein
MSARLRPRSLALPLFLAPAAAAFLGHALLGGDAIRTADVSSFVVGRAQVARLRAEAISHTLACNEGSAIDCGIAAAMLREAAPDDLVRAARLGARAAEAFVDYERRAPAASDDAKARERACVTGDAESCSVAAAVASEDGHAWRAAALSQLACDAGDPLSCETALHARRAAARGDAYARR